jgi:hypothetical protein
MDIHLKGESGLDLTGWSKATHPGVATLILNGQDLPKFREAATRCGARGYLHKDECTPEILCGATWTSGTTDPSPEAGVRGPGTTAGATQEAAPATASGQWRSA